jgi:iron(III) transport system substrate-binding protein
MLPNPAAARRAFDHIISKEVQTALLEGAFRRPSRTDIDVAKIVKLPNVADIKVFTINEDEAAAKRTEFLAEWAAALAAAR